MSLIPMRMRMSGWSNVCWHRRILASGGVGTGGCRAVCGRPGAYVSGAEYPNGFEYRDWVVRALNADLPYDEFVAHQIAGDLMRANRRMTGWRPWDTLRWARCITRTRAARRRRRWMNWTTGSTLWRPDFGADGGVCAVPRPQV